jgi:hypothetical protein
MHQKHPAKEKKRKPDNTRLTHHETNLSITNQRIGKVLVVNQGVNLLCREVGFHFPDELTFLFFAWSSGCRQEILFVCAWRLHPNTRNQAKGMLASSSKRN